MFSLARVLLALLVVGAWGPGCALEHTPTEDAGARDSARGDARLEDPDGGSASGWCPGYVAPPAATTVDCRSDIDCASRGAVCWAPGDTSGLHSAGFCAMECTADADCGAGRVCEAFNGAYCHRCARACTVGSCGPWEACGEDGRCQAARCDADGYACPHGSRCGALGDEPYDAHGCTLAACTVDADCDCGACVLGSCALGPGRCELPRP